MALLCGLQFVFSAPVNSNYAVRTVELEQVAVDYQSVLNQFEDGELTKDGDTTYFNGYQTLSADLFEEFDNISDSDIENVVGCRVEYKFSYNVETNIVTVYAYLHNEEGQTIFDQVYGLGFMNDKNEIDAILNIDGETILLSDLKDLGLIQNCGWLSNLLKGVASVVVGVVANVVTGGAVSVIGVAVGANIAMNVAEKSIAQKNKEHNSKLQQPTTYIYGQGFYADWKYGTRDLSYNGCGVIAVYNAMRKLGKTQKLVDVIYDFDSRSGTLFFGKFGTDPSHLGVYFTAKGVPHAKYYNLSSFQLALNKMMMSQMAIIMYWTGSTLGSEAHYVGITRVPNSNYAFRTFNNAPYEEKAIPEKEIDSSIVTGSIIVGYIVG